MITINRMSPLSPNLTQKSGLLQGKLFSFSFFWEGRGEGERGTQMYATSTPQSNCTEVANLTLHVEDIDHLVIHNKRIRG